MVGNDSHSYERLSKGFFLNRLNPCDLAVDFQCCI
jgi:hypothetical protein